MKTCPSCHQTLPDDSAYCIYCGRKLVKDNNVINENKRKNNFGKLGILLFSISLVCFDFILGSIFQSFKLNIKSIYIISSILYGLSIICGIISFIIDFKDKKHGYTPNGNIGLSMVSIFLSLYMTLMNYSSILMR